MAFTIKIIVVALLVVAPLQAVPANATEQDGDSLNIPGPPSMPPGVRNLGPQGGPAPVPSGDLYHEYGTVMPGGGAKGGRRIQGGSGDDPDLRPGSRYGDQAGTPSHDADQAGKPPAGSGTLGLGPAYRGAPGLGTARGATGGYDGFGGTVIGPGGVIPRSQVEPRRKAAQTPRKLPTPKERQAAIRKALAPKPPLAVAKRDTLDTLYTKLAAAADEDEAKGYASLIAAIWARSGSDTATLLMTRADAAASKKDFKASLDVLDKVVVLEPNWAEAWNKRATVRFLSDDLDGAMSDVDHVLKLEPKHFGALAGMAMILQRTGADKRALQVYRRDLAVYPLQPSIRKIVDELALKVDGQGI